MKTRNQIEEEIFTNTRTRMSSFFSEISPVLTRMGLCGVQRSAVLAEIHSQVAMAVRLEIETEWNYSLFKAP